MPESRSAHAHPGRPGLALLLTAGAALTLAAPALAAPALPLMPADGAAVANTRPAFGWTAGSSGVPIAGYEVFVETPSGPVKVIDAPAGTLSGISSVDLPDDARYRWFVRLTNASGGVASTPVADRAVVHVATPPAPPVIVEGPTGTVRADEAVFSWTGARTDSRWVVLDGDGAPVRAGDSPTPGGRAAPAALGDGAYVFRVSQRNSAGIEGEPAARVFTVDATPPPAPSPAAGGAGQGRGATPAFSWRSTDPGSVSAWRVRGANGTVVEGPTETAQTSATPDPLTPGAYVFEARQTDAAGNVGAWGSEPFSVLPTVATPKSGQSLGTAGTPVGRLRRSAGRLSPPAGATITTTRPVLRWRGAPAGTGLYNLQLFRVGAGNRLTKVASAFPGAARYQPAAGLRRGSCFVWRVWPYRGRGYTASPLGVSDFCVGAAPTP